MCIWVTNTLRVPVRMWHDWPQRLRDCVLIALVRLQSCGAWWYPGFFSLLWINWKLENVKSEPERRQDLPSRSSPRNPASCWTGKGEQGNWNRRELKCTPPNFKRGILCSRYIFFFNFDVLRFSKYLQPASVGPNNILPKEHRIQNLSDEHWGLLQDRLPRLFFTCSYPHL